MSTKPFPEDQPRVTPYLCVDGAAAGIDFYVAVLGASETMRMAGSDGRIHHAELRIGDSVVMVADEFPDLGFRGPRSIGGTPVNLYVYVEDVDAVFAEALSRGATEVSAVKDEFYGDRVGHFEDPFGHRWHVATHVEDVPPDELGKRARKAMSDGA